eukprot:12890324-Prorocentrum_lima.AAC.1
MFSEHQSEKPNRKNIAWNNLIMNSDYQTTLVIGGLDTPGSASEGCIHNFKHSLWVACQNNIQRALLNDP